MSTPDKLNERPIYLRGVFLFLAIAQSVIHIYNDFSAIKIPASPLPSASTPDQGTHRIPAISAQLQSALLPILRRSVAVSGIMALLAPFPYTFFLRHLFWSWHLTFAKLYYNISRSDARPNGFAPAGPSMMLRSFGAGFLLLLTWEVTSFLFTALLARQPLKKGQVLSAASKDPNGTLLNGLKAKTEVVKTYAFWEFALIARSFPERRKAIFADIERQNGTCWAQMQVAALDVIRGINMRIEATTLPAAEKMVAQQVVGTGNAAKGESLPKIVPVASNKPIFANATPPRTSRERLQSASGTLAKSLGQSPKPWSPPVAKVKRLLEDATSSLSQEPATEQVHQYWAALNASQIGWFFKRSNQRSINAVVLGSGHARTALIVDAVEVVTRMLVASLLEDAYGKAISGVPEAVRTFAKAVSSIEAFVQKNGEGLASGIGEVEVVVQRLKAGLAELLSAFQLYLSDVGLEVGELTAAKKAAEKRSLLLKQCESDQATITSNGSSNVNQARKTKLEGPGQRENSQQVANGQQREMERHEKPTTRRIERANNDSTNDWNGRLNLNREPLFARREMEMVQ